MCLLAPEYLTGVEPGSDEAGMHTKPPWSAGALECSLGGSSQGATSIACLQVEEQKCSGEVQGLTTVTILVALATFPASSAAVYVTV